jgi:8-oxo-dGTP diphosphatase
MVSDQQAKTCAHATLATVFQVRDNQLQVLLWQRARAPHAHAWALPGGSLDQGETLEQSIRRHLAAKVDVRELSHLEQLETRSEPNRNPRHWELATAYLGLIRADADPAVPSDTRWHAVEELPALAFDHQPIILGARERLRGKLSYSNLGFALAPATFTLSELRDLYRAALGHDLTATNLQRVLLRRHLIQPAGSRRQPGRNGGRPAQTFTYTNHILTITDHFATLRPPTQ